MNNFEKYLSEQEKESLRFIRRDGEYRKLVSQVSDKIRYTGEGATEFIYDLLTNINFHSEAKDTYNFLMSKLEKMR